MRFHFSASGRMLSPSSGLVKVALRREPGYPIGQPAPVYLVCACGEKLPANGTANLVCQRCNREYTVTGWMVFRTKEVPHDISN